MKLNRPQSLRKKLVMIILAILIPLNILVLVLSQRMEELMKEKWLDLNPNSRNYELARYDVWSELQEVCKEQRLEYVSGHSGNGSRYF